MEITSQTQATALVEDERQFEKHRNEALEKGNLKEAAESHHLLNIAQLGREKCRKAGVPLEKFRVLKGGEEAHALTLGVCEQKPDAVGRVALADVQTFAKSAETAEEAAENMVSAAEHEDKHKKSHENALRRGEAGVIVEHLGEDLNHDLQETMAREDTTKGKDAYDEEESRVNIFAARIGSSRTTINRLLLEGREARIVEMARDTGYKMAG